MPGATPKTLSEEPAGVIIASELLLLHVPEPDVSFKVIDEAWHTVAGRMPEVVNIGVGGLITFTGILITHPVLTKLKEIVAVPGVIPAVANPVVALIDTIEDAELDQVPIPEASV